MAEDQPAPFVELQPRIEVKLQRIEEKLDRLLAAPPTGGDSLLTIRLEGRDIAEGRAELTPSQQQRSARQKRGAL